MSMTTKQKVQGARTTLVLDQPFFGVLALRLHIVDDPGCGTAWTDGVSMGYDPEFVDQLTQNELVAVIAHEVMHCANGHPWRRDNREALRWNYACDYAINPVIEEAGFKLPRKVISGRPFEPLRDKAFDGKSAEWIFARLPETKVISVQLSGSGSGAGKGQNSPGKQGGSGAGKGSGQPGSSPDASGTAKHGHFPAAGGLDVRDAPASAAAAGVTEAEWQQAVQQAAVSAKARGMLPSCLERFAAQAATPRVNWRSVLHRFVQQAAREDYSWRMPNPRYIASGLYMPAMHSESVGPLAIAVDTSGSIDAVLLSQFAAELRSVADDVRPLRIHVIYCDAKVHTVETFERDDIIELKPLGGGGTSFVPVMDWCDEQDEPPVALIYLTDLDGSHRPEPPGMPVLWASPREAGRLTPPYGEVVVLQ
jgi:predicted metal-dependent peptidase